ncbi:MAG: TonB-dependent receptor [Cyclobacteriaceae bacterium]
MKKPEIFVFVLCSLFSFSAFAQNDRDSVRQLKTVIVQQSRLNDYVIASYELPLDSSVLALASNGSLTDLLRKQGFGHIRTYGPGGLASPSFRGTGSSHTAVLWNGINLISPLSGQLDLSLVPAGLFDDATIQTGGSTSLSGNGSIGANIHLNNNLNFNEGLRATASTFIGSFGSQYYDAGIRLSNKRVGMSTKIFFNASENDFKFTNRSVFPAESQRREHSAFDQHGLLQQLHWNSQRAGVFSLKFWYQKSYYEIPNPTGIIRPSEATEENEFYRALAGWSFSKEIFDFNYQTAFIRQDLDYADPLTDQYSLNRYNSTIHNFETNINFRDNAQLTSGIHYTWEQGIVNDFGNSPVRNRIALFSAYKFEAFKKWNFAISCREEFVNGDPMPFSPTVSAKYKVNEKFNAFINLSRNYRIPTFNDLYWKGGGAQGNPNLRTETSWSAEAGVEFTNQLISFKSVVFDNHVDNWIQWSPSAGQVWSPQNIKKVWSRGVESKLSLSWKIGQVQSRLMGQYSLTKSTNESIYENGNVNEKGKQLLLTPIHEGSATVEGEWKKIILRIVNSYTGEQFNDSDNSPYHIVRDYLITNIWLSKVVEQKKITLVFTGEINNVFNMEYVGRPGYPMPGRNFKAGIKINFNKPNKL